MYYLEEFSMKKSEKKKLDKEFQERVLNKYNNRCVICGKKAFGGHHIIPRVYLETRWDIENGIALSMDCHAKVHTNPYFKDWFIEEFVGESLYEELRRTHLLEMCLISKDLLQQFINISISFWILIKILILLF